MNTRTALAFQSRDAEIPVKQPCRARTGGEESRPKIVIVDVLTVDVVTVGEGVVDEDVDINAVDVDIVTAQRRLCHGRRRPCYR